MHLIVAGVEKKKIVDAGPNAALHPKAQPLHIKEIALWETDLYYLVRMVSLLTAQSRCPLGPGMTGQFSFQLMHAL